MRRDFFKKAFGLTLLSLIIFTGCASTEPDLPVPQWLSEGEKVYPNKDYLFKIGSGYSALEAKNNGQSELAAFFSTSVNRVIETETVYDTDNSNNTSRKADSKTVTTIDLDFFAMETTEPYYFKAEKKWYCGAYINRKTAFEQMEPAVRDDANRFYGILKQAEKTKDPVKKIRIYKNTKEVSKDFVDDLYTLLMFSKPLTEERFGKDRDVVSGLDGLIQQELNNCVFYFDVPVDSAKIVTSAAKKIFSDNGFYVTENRSDSYYIVDVIVNYNEEVEGSGDDALYVLFPSIKIAVKGPDGSVYSYERTFDRNMSYVQKKAQTKACENIADLLNKELYKDFANQVGFEK